MQKTIKFILFTIYMIILFALVVVMFWEFYGKEFVENYIKKEYGDAIIQTKNNSELSLQILQNDESE